MYRNNRAVIRLAFFFAGLLFVGAGMTPETISGGVDPWFDSNVISNPAPVVVKFGSERCPPCRAIDKNIKLVRREFSQALFLNVNVDQKPDVFRAYSQGGGIPQLAIFHRGKIIARAKGYRSEDALRSWLQNTLPVP